MVIRSVALVGALLIAPAICWGQVSMIRVEVENQVEFLRNLHGDALTTAIQRRFLEELRATEDLRHWDFASGAASPFRLRVTLEPKLPGDPPPIDVQVDLLNNKEKLSHGWSSPWRTVKDAGKNRGFGSIEEVSAEVIAVLEDKVLPALHTRLSEKVPLGFGARIRSWDHIALSLPWTRFIHLRRSAFRLLCPRQSHARIECNGMRDSVTYESYSAVGAKASCIEDDIRGRRVASRAPEIKGLQPEMIYLYRWVRENEPLAFTDDEECQKARTRGDEGE